MTSHAIDPTGILNIFYQYVAINSETATVSENAASAFVHKYFQSKPYFQTHPDHFGLKAIPQDPFDREIAWALVKGNGSRTAVLVHHFDVVEIEDFKLLRSEAFDPVALAEILIENPESLSAHARADLRSGDWIFGRGTADMKAGGSIQMALIDSYSQLDSFQGNVLLLAVPDEESLSAGMRAASPLLTRLKRTHTLDYVLMINSEPHQRKVIENGILSGGSIGKILPFIYVRGILAHAGKSPEGFNPVAILSEVVHLTEMSLELAEYNETASEMSPPPTWLMARDSKAVYDVSMPLTAFGCLSVQPLSNRPDQILSYLHKIVNVASSTVADKINVSADLFHERTRRPTRQQAWQPTIQTFSELLASARELHGTAFEVYYRNAISNANKSLKEGSASYAAATWTLMDAIFDYIGCEQPAVIIGYVPPYYPSVSHLDRPDYDRIIRTVSETLNHHTQSQYHQAYDLESYFTGISDLSYSSLKEVEATTLENIVAGEMPLYGESYSIPFADIVECAMPCINIGPWGKDFHKISERVLKEDMVVRTPSMIQCALKAVLEG